MLISVKLFRSVGVAMRLYHTIPIIKVLQGLSYFTYFEKFVSFQPLYLHIAIVIESISLYTVSDTEINSYTKDMCNYDN